MEMILVLAIISLLVGLGAFAMKNVMVDAKIDKVRADVKNLQTNLIRYEAKAGFPPSTEQGLKALVEMPTAPPKPKRWSQTLGAEALMDPYGSYYQYRNPGVRNTSGQDIFSMGADKQANTEDDIGNWE